MTVDSLVAAYKRGVFPWFSADQPILWWAPDPRMVLPVREFKIHRSFRKTLQRFAQSSGCEIRIDTAFARVIGACASQPRPGQSGTWIMPEMVQAYIALHAAGHAHSVETWIDGDLRGGLYCVAIGRAVFGESMFARTSDASKIALAALVGLCQHHGVELIDCQQNTPHLASLGSREISRTSFLQQVEKEQLQASPRWVFSPVYWDTLLSTNPELA